MHIHLCFAIENRRIVKVCRYFNFTQCRYLFRWLAVCKYMKCSFYRLSDVSCLKTFCVPLILVMLE
jgi:hypothetical protein